MNPIYAATDRRIAREVAEADAQAREDADVRRRREERTAHFDPVDPDSKGRLSHPLPPGVPVADAVVEPARIAREVAEADCRRCAREQAAAAPPKTYLSALVAAYADCDRMYTCPTCGNKRCPKATDHDLPCTGSNEPGQPGSDYR